MMKVNGVHNEKELADFIAKEQCVEMEKDTVQYKHIFIEDYTPTESAYIFKMQHCLADGLALINYLYVLQDDDNVCSLPKMRHFSFLEKVLIYLCSPIAIIYANINGNRLGAQNNCIANHMKPTGNKVVCFGNDISFSRVSEKAKEMKITINDFLMGITSVSIKEYMVS